MEAKFKKNQFIKTLKGVYPISYFVETYTNSLNQSSSIVREDFETGFLIMVKGVGKFQESEVEILPERVECQHWWDTLNIEKCIKLRKKYGFKLNRQISIDEILTIWKAETNPQLIQSAEHLETVMDNIFKTKTPNKQYTELDLELFGKHLAKFNDKDKRKMFSFMCQEMQKQVIGYLKIGQTWEPAISETESFMPLNSFGISNTHGNFQFAKFPDNKTLTDMLKTPFEFHTWSKENLK